MDLIAGPYSTCIHLFIIDLQWCHPARVHIKNLQSTSIDRQQQPIGIQIGNGCDIRIFRGGETFEGFGLGIKAVQSIVSRTDPYLVSLWADTRDRAGIGTSSETRTLLGKGANIDRSEHDQTVVCNTHQDITIFIVIESCYGIAWKRKLPVPLYMLELTHITRLRIQEKQTARSRTKNDFPINFRHSQQLARGQITLLLRIASQTLSIRRETM